MKRRTAREILDILVAFQTVSRDSNLAMIEWVEEYLSGFGVASTRVYNDDGTKASLYANVGPMVEGGIVLSGHSDVVPVDGQDWSTDPFVVTEIDGKMFGRGTCDMKGFVAIALAAVPKAIESGLKRPLQIALSYDEEIGCVGAPAMIAEMAQHLPRAAAAIIGEPSMMQAVNGHKGSTGYKVHMRGFEVHSSFMHEGVNAIMFGARLIEWANQINAENRALNPTAMAQIFTPPWTTLHIGEISGGTAHNITAKDCHFMVDFRFVPGDELQVWEDRFFEKVKEIEAEMQAIVPETGIDITVGFSIPPLRPETNGRAEELVRSLTGDNAIHVVSYGTEAGQFQDAGYSAIVCGPGDIAQAHQPDEFITVAQFEAGEAFVDRIVDHLCASTQ